MVILTMENRSFDEYYGTFPGVDGFGTHPKHTYESFDLAKGRMILPFRLSTFTSPYVLSPSAAHDTTSQHTYFDSGALDGWLFPLAADGFESGNPVECVGYYTADDIPFHWWLADTFLLCDAYFSSVMGATAPNRFYLMSGRIEPGFISPTEFLSDPHEIEKSPRRTDHGVYIPPPWWVTYADVLHAAHKTWCVYDLQGEDSPLNWDLNALTYFPEWPALKSDRTHKSGLAAFRDDAASGRLPLVSWVIPAYSDSEHPDYPAPAGAKVIFDVLLALTQDEESWRSTVLIVNYDENGGYFDHVVPPQPSRDDHDEFIEGRAIGAGFRVPALVISPWTVGLAPCHTRFDHTSVLRFLDDVTGVRFADGGITSFRRRTFRSLSEIPWNKEAVQVADLPPFPDAHLIWTYAAARYGVARLREIESSSTPGVPSHQTWPPVRPQCKLDLSRSTYTRSDVVAAQRDGVATFLHAATVRVEGFEPEELTTRFAVAPLGSVTPPHGQAPVPPRPIVTRVPSIQLLDSHGNAVPSVRFVCSNVAPNPTSTHTSSGVPETFEFTYSLEFTDPNDPVVNGNQTARLTARAAFAVDTTVTSSATLELTGS